jgi:hypothetical protein
MRASSESVIDFFPWCAWHGIDRTPFGAIARPESA